MVRFWLRGWHSLFLPPLAGEVRLRSRWEGGVAYCYVLSLQYLTPIPFACAKVLPPITIEGRKRGAVLQMLYACTG